jgi:hypothetical protein
MKILYAPFKIIAGVVGSKLGHSIFKGLWGRIDDAEPPRPTTAEASFSKVVAAAALEAATLASVAAVVNRASARAFHYLTGVWPGEERPESSEEKS